MIREVHHGHWQRPSPYCPGELEFMEISGFRIIIEVPVSPERPATRASMRYWIHPDDPDNETYLCSRSPDSEGNRFTHSTRADEIVISMADRSWVFTTIPHEDLPESSRRRFNKAHETMNAREQA